MELAAALHHSWDARSEVAHEALRGTEDGKLRDAAGAFRAVVRAAGGGHSRRCGRGGGRPHKAALRRRRGGGEEGVGDGVGEEGRAAAACHRVC